MIKLTSRRRWPLCWLISIYASLSFAQTAEGSFFQHTYRLIAPMRPGQSTDLIARQVALRLGNALNQPVAVMNLPGAGGSVAVTSALQAPPDGQTLLLATFGSVVIAPLLNPKLPYTHESLKPLIALSSDASVLIASSSNRLKALDELKKLAMTAKGARIGYMGVGSSGHLLTLKLQTLWGTRFIGVSYKDTANALRDLAAGEIDALALTSSTASLLIRNQTAQGLAISDSHRHPCIPQVRTFKEQGLDIEIPSWMGLFVSSTTPQRITDELTKELKKIQDSEEMKGIFKSACITPAAVNAQQFMKVIQNEVVLWREEIRQSVFETE